MLTPKFRSHLEEFHRRRWFPNDYPDPYDEFVDYVSEGMITDLTEAWKQEKRNSYLNVAFYLLRLLPQIQFRDIFSEYKQAMSQTVTDGVLPEFAYFWIRNSSEERGSQIWTKLQKWCDNWDSIFSSWSRVLLTIESSHATFHKSYAELLQLSRSDDDILRKSLDFFSWQVANRTGAHNYFEFLRYFQLPNWKDVAQWNDLPALARSIAEMCGIPALPAMRASDHAGIQYSYPISPPGRMLIEYGRSEGPYDAMRFLIELGKGSFYAGMNPDLPVEERVCGDPTLPWFWGYLFASVLAETEGIKTFVALKAEDMREDTNFVLQCWYRYDLFLAIYRIRAMEDFASQDHHFRDLWELLYPFKRESFLSLFELCRSQEALFRCTALLRSQLVIRQLREKYGSKWFANKKWITRARDYWWEGFSLTGIDVLRDLQVPTDLSYPF
jgi:hypothetical protein